jgi:Ca2+-binding RTX toxin-like protein
MSTIYLAGNRLPINAANEFGHLQLVSGGQEIEVQLPSDYVVGWVPGIEDGTWEYEFRSHNGYTAGVPHTAGYGEDGYYSSIAIDLGDRDPDQVWDDLVQIQEAFESQTSISYLLLSQNSNSFINTLLYMIGIDVGLYLSGASPSPLFLMNDPETGAPVMTEFLGFPAVNKNVLLDPESSPSFTLSLTTDDDTLRTGFGNDSISGETGNDYIDVFGGNDTVKGGDGDDTILGGDDDDDLYGGAGHDLLDGGSGDNALYGGAGDDILIFDAQGGPIDLLDGGSGFDIAYFSPKPSFDTATPLTIDMASIGIEAIVSGFGADDITSDGSTIRLIASGDGDDIINVVGGGGAPTIVWGGAGSDTISVQMSQNLDPVGILVVNTSNLTEENFHLFDLESLDMGSSFDWGAIDVVLVNPDAQDEVIVNDQVLEVNQGSPLVLEDNVTIAIFDGDEGQIDVISAYTSAGYTIVSDEIITPTEAPPEGPIQSYREVRLSYSTTVANPENYTTLQDQYGSWIAPVYEFKESFLNGDTQNSILSPSGFTSMIMLSEIDGVMDTYGLDLGNEAATGPLVTVTDEYGTDWTIQQHWYFLPWQGYPSGYSSGEVTSFNTSNIVFSESEAITNWFMIGGSMTGTSIIGNNAITITMPDPDDETSGSSGGVHGGRYGNSSSGSNLTGGEGVSRVTGFNTNLNSIFVGGVALGASSLPTGITASEVDGSTIITYGQDDHVVLRGVSLAAWQAGAAGQILGGLSDDALTGTAGNDVFAGGGGDDTITAGAGDDHITYSSGNDLILGDLDNTGTDTLDLGRFAASDVRFAVSGDDVLITTTDGTIRLADQVLHEVGDPLSNIEAITLSDGTLSETDILVRAIADQQTIGDDVIQGTSWVDYINGSAGNDIITGGAGADEFWFADSFGNDEITDFEAADHIVFVGSETISDFTDMLADHTTQVGSDVLIADGDGNTVLIKNFLMANLSESNFQFW